VEPIRQLRVLCTPKYGQRCAPSAKKHAVLAAACSMQQRGLGCEQAGSKPTWCRGVWDLGMLSVMQCSVQHAPNVWNEHTPPQESLGLGPKHWLVPQVSCAAEVALTCRASSSPDSMGGWWGVAIAVAYAYSKVTRLFAAPSLGDFRYL
jgi:hypothetical protein